MNGTDRGHEFIDQSAVSQASTTIPDNRDAGNSPTPAGSGADAPPNPGRNQVATSVAIIVALVLAGFLLTREARSDEAKSAAASDPNVATASASAAKALNIETGTVQQINMDGSIAATGLVSFPSDRTVKVSPRLTGRVRQVFVRLGDHVRVGQPLAILDSVDAATAQSTFRQNENAARQAKLDLQRQQRLFKLGTPDVTSAQAVYNQAVAATAAAKVVLDLSRHQEQIGGFTQKPVEDATNALVSAESALSQARADLALAQKDYDRKKKLLAIGVVAQTDMEQSQDAYDKAKVSVQADEESVGLARQALDREQKAFKSNLYADQTVRQNEAAYRQAQIQESAALRALQIAKAQLLRDLEQARTDLQTAELNLENSRHALDLLGRPNSDGTVPITSPIDGVVTERDVSPGQVVDQSQETPWQMFVVSNSDSVWVDADVHEGDIARVTKGAAVTIQVAGAPGRQFAGVVFDISPILDKTSHTVKVRSILPNPQGLLRDGMYADVTLHVGGARNALVVPMSAISHEQDADYVYVPAGEQYHRRLVKLGAALGDRVIVTDGLKPGESIVTHGSIFLGSKVTDD